MSDSTSKTAVPSAQQSNPDNADNEIKQALGYCRKALVSIGLFSFVINMLMLTGPLFMLQVYDRVLASRSIPTLIALTVLIAGLFGFMGILEVIRSKVLVRIGLKLDSVLTERVFNIWVLQGLLKSAGKKTSPLADLTTVRQFLSGNAPVALFDLPWVPFYLTLVFLLHWTLGLVAVVGALIVFVLALTNELSTRNHLKKGAAHTAAAGSYADQSHRNAETVLAMGMGENVQNLPDVPAIHHSCCWGCLGC
ncbi:ABC transporter transmembrane domain-containing protein [Kiloniella sp. EL199]|uniref:ABC transporter transmembrane domain-containing protein n=1 Tax=Kiloniella sp. EL199 TaxID=2107581 RepID=UPI001C1F2825|nr:ABC transporter transmembrane domain-containing protein [Kiloniella sp. EL199]